MGSKTRALIWCIAFLGVAETGLRQAERRLVPEGGLPVGRPLFVALGTSRTLRGVVPRVVGEALRQGGISRSWVGNVSIRGRTMVGLYQHYMDRVHPRMNPALDPAVLAIEVRGAGLNDSHLEQKEQRFARQQRFDEAFDGEPGGATVDAETMAQGLVGRLALSRAGDIVEAWRHPEELDTPRWLEQEAGWAPFLGKPPEGMKRSLYRPHYKKTLLADYAVGGVQTTYLRRLVRQARADGWTVVLYVVPVTDIQRGFWDPGDLARYREHLRTFGREEGVPVLDFDDGHDFPLDEFWDTHHLHKPGARRFSRLLGEALVEFAR